MTPLPSAHLATWATVAFVPLWSSAVIVGAVALRHGPPFAVTTARFAVATLLLTILSLMFRATWPRGTALLHAAIVGLLLQGGHYAGIYAGLAAGISAGTTGLVVGLIPVATAIGAVPLLGERFTTRRVLACILGSAAAGVVAWSKLGLGSAAGEALAALALLSGAGAALWQKRFGVRGADLPSAAIQLLVGTLVMAGCGLAFERDEPGISWTLEFIGAFAWLVVANSVGATLLLMWLLARGAAGRVTGLFFLVPPITAVGAAAILGELPTNATLIAIVLGTAAVWVLLSETAVAERASSKPARSQASA